MYISIHSWRGKSIHKLNSRGVFLGGRGVLNMRSQRERRGECRQGNLVGQGNGGWREAVEGLGDQVGRGVGEGCVGAGRVERKSGDGFVGVDDGCRCGKERRPGRGESGSVCWSGAALGSSIGRS